MPLDKLPLNIESSATISTAAMKKRRQPRNFAAN